MHVRGFERGKPVAAARALERGAETIQIFASNPRAWHLTPISDEADREFARQMKESDVRPLFLHAPYLVNLVSSSAQFRRRSFGSLQWTFDRGLSLQAAGVVVHAGSGGDRKRPAMLRGMALAIKRLLGETSGPRLVLELTAGGRGAVASYFKQAGEVFDACGGHPRLAICIDTCHLHAAGYDLTSAEGVDATIDELRETVGVDRLALIHPNDSRDARGSHRDRHWHVGKGRIGIDGFRALVSTPELKDVPMICETPGVLRDDRRNIWLLKRLRDARKSL